MSYFDSNDVIPKYYLATDVIYIYLQKNPELD